MVQFSATRCSCVASLLVSLVSFVAITLCVASKRVFIVVSVYFVIDSVWNLLDTPSHTNCHVSFTHYRNTPLLPPVGSVSSSTMYIWRQNPICKTVCLSMVRFHIESNIPRHSEHNTAMVGTCCHLSNAPGSNSQVLEKWRISLLHMLPGTPEKRIY